jgi:hypothetical protein
MFCTGTRHELAIADGQGPERQEALVTLGQRAHQVSQEFESPSVFCQALGRSRRDRALSAEHGRVDEEIGKEWFAGRAGHGQQASCLAETKGYPQESGQRRPSLGLRLSVASKCAAWPPTGHCLLRVAYSAPKRSSRKLRRLSEDWSKTAARRICRRQLDHSLDIK